MMLPRCSVLLMMAAVANGFVCPLVFMERRGLHHRVGATWRGNGYALSMCCPPTVQGGPEDLSDKTPMQQPSTPFTQAVSRRSVLFAFAATALPLLGSSPAVAADTSKGLLFTTTPSGLQFADAKVGTGTPLKPGAPCTVDYVMSTSGARYGSKIYSTTEVEKPFRWVIGDGTTIKGLEQAIIGGDGVPPMLPGGVRRVIIPESLGYKSLAKPLAGMQFQNCQEGQGPGPIPPDLTGKGEGAYQRFKNIYCNANRPYQPDLVMDIKLYGKRET